ncbi:MAG: hypothetical protein KAI76_10500 [Alphaproteobacteria bacterium]|nr:hypothetical protein [Alphaproteobacteria bacterium]
MAKIRIKGFFLLLLTTGILMTALPSFAQKAGNPALLKQFEAAGGKIDFLGTAYGMDSWIITDKKDEKKVQFAYATPEGALILGMMYAPDGTLETRKQLEALKQRTEGSQAAAPGAENSQLKAEKFYAKTEKANWIAIGDSQAPYLYIFINANCGDCHKYWNDLEDSIKEGKLQVRLVPFGEQLGNRNGGAALLSVENSEEAWRSYIDGNTAALSKDKIKDGAYQKIKENNMLAKNWKEGAAPFTLYRRPGDGILTAIVGRPDNTLLLLTEFLK